MALCRQLEGFTDDNNALFHGRLHRTAVIHAAKRMAEQSKQVAQSLNSLNHKQLNTIP